MERRLNAYICEDLHITVTNDKDEGTTPFMIPCPVCNSAATSRMYKVNNKNENLKPTHEWYKPEPKEWDLLSDNAIEHVKQGGLMLRKIPKKKPEKTQK